jgi:hypothetical protein
MCTAANSVLNRTRAPHSGADVDVQDPDGYTPLHMAAGYLHVEAVNELLQAGADLARTDRSSRNVRDLIDSLRDKMTSASAIQQRMRLEQVQPSLPTYLSVHTQAPRPPHTGISSCASLHLMPVCDAAPLACACASTSNHTRGHQLPCHARH